MDITRLIGNGVQAEMFIPIRTDYRMRHIPWVNYALVAINVVVFLMGYNGTELAGHKIDRWMLDCQQPELPQFVTSVFLHGGWMHLIGNMIFLWVFGNAVNDKLGNVPYLLFYLAGGVIACLGDILLIGEGTLLGASGAIAAVTGAYLVLLPRARVTLLLLWYYITYFEVSSLLFIAFQVAYNMWMSVSDMGGGKHLGGIAYGAHISGYAFGIAVAIALLLLRVLSRDDFDLLHMVVNFRRRQSYKAMVNEGYDPYNPVSPKLRPVATVQVTPPPLPPSAAEVQLRHEINEAMARGDLATSAGKYLQLQSLNGEAFLSRQQQLDVANYFMGNDQYQAAAGAYERFLQQYSTYPYVGDIYLMLGLLYGRYLHQDDLAEKYLRQCLHALREQKKLAMAQQELDAVLQRKPG